MKHMSLAVALLSVSTFSAAASLSSMSASDVTDVLSDKTITTISAATLNGKVLPNTFTGYYSRDGKMHGGFALQPDGAPQTDKGTWQVKSDGRICMTWEHWVNAKEECVSFYKLQNGLLIVGADDNFESVILNTEIQSGDKTKSGQ